MWRSESGVTLLEALVSLAVMALVLTVVVSRMRPSENLVSEEKLAEFIDQIVDAKARAISSGDVVVLQSPGQGCSVETSTVRFFPDGTAHGNGLCIEAKNGLVLVAVNPLTAVASIHD